MIDGTGGVPKGKAPRIEWPLPGVTLDQMIERADPAVPRYPDADRLYAKIRGHRLIATLAFAACFHVVTPKLWRDTPAQHRELGALRDAVVERFSGTGR